jgi:DNA-binding NarL/FixJ family response regulator
MIRVLLADDHGVIRDGLGRLIAALDDIELVGVAVDGEDAVCRETAPGVVLMDLDMPRVDGIEATRRITAELAGTAVLVLTSFSDRKRILGALDAGACGYLLKDAASDEVAEGIRAASRGESPLDPRAARTIINARAEPEGRGGVGEGGSMSASARYSRWSVRVCRTSSSRGGSRSRRRRSSRTSRASFARSG